MKRLAVAAVVVAGALVSCAANGTWTGTSGNVWADNGNWDATPYPQGDETATFAPGGGTVDLTGLTGIRSLTFTGAAFTLGASGQSLVWRHGGTFTLAGGAAAQEIAADVTLGQDGTAATYTIVNDSAAALRFGGTVTAPSAGAKTLTVRGSGPVEFAGNLVKGGSSILDMTVEGTGTITLSGMNNVMRMLNLNGPAGGVLDIGAGDLFLQNGGSAVLRTQNGATINGTGSITLSGGQGDDGSDNGAVGVNAVLTINPRLTGPAGFEYWIGNNDAAGTVVFNGINDFQGNIAINSAGTISASIIGNRGSTISNLGQGQHILFNGNGTGSGLRYTGTGETTDRIMRLPKSARFDMSGTGRLVFAEPFTITGGGANTIYLSGSTEGVGEIAGAIGTGTGTYSIQKSGTGEWELSATNTFTGTLTVTGGTLALANTNAASGTAAISNGGLLLLKGEGHAKGVTGFMLSNGGTLELSNTAAANISDRVSAAAPINLQGSTLAITHDAAAAADYETVLGNVTVGAGSSVIRTAAATAPGSSATLRLGALLSSGGGILTFEGEGIGESDANRIFIGGLPNNTIGAWASVNGQMAAYDSVRGVYAVDDSEVTYTDIDAWGDVIPDDANANVRIAAHGSGSELELESAVTSVARLLHDTDIDAVAVMAGKTLQTSGVRINAGADALTLGQTAGDGTLTALPGGTMLSLDNASAAALRVNAAIADNSAPLTLVKLGMGPVLLSGPLEHTGGTLLMGDGLTIDNADNMVLGSVISGNGSWAKSGSGTLRLNAVNTFTNTFTISAGAVIPGNNQALGTPDSTVVIEDGAALDLNNGMAQNTLNLNKRFIMSGFGQDRKGAVVNSGNIQYNTFGKITLAGDTGFGGPVRWDMRSNSPELTLDGHTLYKVDANEVSLVNTVINPDRSDGTKGRIEIEGGIFTLESNTQLNGGSENTLSVRSGGLLHLWAHTMPAYWSLILDDGASFGAGSGGGGTQNVWRGPVAVTGDVAFIRGQTKAIEGNITGTGSIRHLEGVTHLKGTNTYAGATTVSNGQLHAFTPYTLPNWQSGSVTGAAGTVVLYTGDGENGWTKQQILAYKDATSMLTPHWFGMDTTQVSLDFTEEIGGTFSLAKFGNGLMTLRGGLDITGVLSVNGALDSSILTLAPSTSNACTGINVSGGTMNVNGPVYMNMSTVDQRVQVVNGNGRGIMNINADIETGAFRLGTASNAFAAVIHNSGDVKSAPALRSQEIFSIGMNNFGYGYYRMNGGTHETGQLSVNGNTTGTGVLDIFGGTISIVDGWLLTCWGGGNGIINLYGGTLSSRSVSSGVNLTDAGDKNSFSMVNMLGNNAVLDLALRHATYGVEMAKLGSNSLSAVNLNAGRMIAPRIYATADTTPTFLNFNGGTLKASAGGTLLNGSLWATTLYDGGGIIDTDTNSVIIKQSLLAPVGYGVSDVTLAAPGSGYMGPPIVRLTGGSGTGALAIATIDLDAGSPAFGQLTGITVTAPGSGYQAGDILTATLTGGGGTGASVGPVPLAPHAQTGGLTKCGTGTLLLMQENTYKGVTHVAEGTLRIATDAGLYEGRLSNGSGGVQTNWASSNPKTDIQLSPRMGNTNQGWTNETTYVYSGFVWNRSGTNETWSFAKSFDDAILLTIDGNVVMDHTKWDAIEKASYLLTPGPHAFEVRFGQGGGGVGPVSQGWWTTTAMGFGYDPRGSNSSNLADYLPMADRGDGTLFTLTTQSVMRVIAESSGIIVDEGATLDLGGGTVTLQNISGGGQVINGSLALTGDLMPGGNGTIGTLTFGADLAVAATYRADVRADGTSDRVVVNGNVDLSQMALRVIDTAQLSTRQPHIILTATGTITGAFASDNLPSSAWKISYAANSVKIVPGGTKLILR